LIPFEKHRVTNRSFTPLPILCGASIAKVARSAPPGSATVPGKETVRKGHGPSLSPELAEIPGLSGLFFVNQGRSESFPPPRLVISVSPLVSYNSWAFGLRDAAQSGELHEIARQWRRL
jgi:hypothetical protein